MTKIRSSILDSLSQSPTLKETLQQKPNPCEPRRKKSPWPSKATSKSSEVQEKGIGPLRSSLRPNKHTLKTLILLTEKSEAEKTDTWSEADDVRVIRLKECLRFRWPVIRTYFPTRPKNAAEQRYAQDLRKGKNDSNITVPVHLLYPGREQTSSSDPILQSTAVKGDATPMYGPGCSTFPDKVLNRLNKVISLLSKTKNSQASSMSDSQNNEEDQADMLPACEMFMDATRHAL
jgi:hypothetical protein